MNSVWFKYEWNRSLKTPHAFLSGLGLGAVLLGTSQWLMPRIPPGAMSLLRQSFHLRSVGDMVLLNDLLAMHTVLFFVGVGLLLPVFVVPREEGQWAWRLAKPLTGIELIVAPTVPALTQVAALGLLLSAGCAWAVSPFPGGLTSPSAAFFGGLVLTVFDVMLLALAQAAWTVTHESFQALLAAFALWVAPLITSSLCVYRPDLLRGAAVNVVFPANLIWAGASLGTVLVVALLVTTLLAAAATWLTSVRLRHLA